MKTVVFAGLKGGAGKTTLAFNVAAFAAKTDSVILADMDPQKSLETFAEIRAGENPVLLRDVGSLRRAISDLQKTGLTSNFLIADSPGSFVKIVRDAVGVADCVVVPLRPSPIDVLAQEDLIPILKELGKLAVTLPVITCIDGRTSIADFVERIGEMFIRPPVLIRNRFAYARALVAGKAGFEIDKGCSAEIADLWAAILQIVRQA